MAWSKLDADRTPHGPILTLLPFPDKIIVILLRHGAASPVK